MGSSFPPAGEKAAAALCCQCGQGRGSKKKWQENEKTRVEQSWSGRGEEGQRK